VGPAVTILPANRSLEAAPWDAVGSRLARSIVVVSALSGGVCHGMTADSFTLVSRDPPLVMVAVAAGGRTHGVLASAPGFAVSVLTEGQSAVATHFASRRRPPGWRQFDVVAWQAAPYSGAPVLLDALTWLDCTRRDLVGAGDHVLVLGEVLSVSSGTRAQRPLVRYDGHYSALRDG
jgi:flavin reductase (DIM6/NTAB) family NADH-FMN oxidoreductase RutF